MTGRWEPGATIVHHEVWAQRVWAARPVVVVEDAYDVLLLWLPAGTVRKVPAPPAGVRGRERDPAGLPTEASHRGVIENLQRGQWTHVDHVWDVSTLLILRPGRWHAVWVSWLPSGEHLGWYVNFQRPYCRTSAGIEAMDLMLDLVVDPDHSWRWKDQHEFEVMARRGLLDAATIESVLDEAEAVVASIEAAEPPFCEPWPTWTPQPEWMIPRLPADWNAVPT